MSLEKETATFDREKPNLLASEGKFVVISGDSILGKFDSYEDALGAGYEKCGLKPFLVRQIQAVEQIQHFGRDLELECPT